MKRAQNPHMIEMFLRIYVGLEPIDGSDRNVV